MATRTGDNETDKAIADAIAESDGNQVSETVADAKTPKAALKVFLDTGHVPAGYEVNFTLPGNIRRVGDDA